MVTPDKARRVGAIVQARVSSTRLPGKVLLPLPYGSGISVCEHVIRRLKKVKNIDRIIIATTSNAVDNKIVNVANTESIACFRGSEQDVLSRFFEAAQEHQLDEIIRVTADNPCTDYALIDWVVQAHLRENNDYTATQQYPVGLNVEVLSFKALEIAHENTEKPEERRHVTPYVYSHHDTFKISEKNAQKNCQHPGIRLTLDTEEDYALLCAVFDYLYFENKYFNVHDIINLFEGKPWLKLINKRVMQKKIFNSLEDELAEAVDVLDLQELKRAKELLARHLP